MEIFVGWSKGERVLDWRGSGSSELGFWFAFKAKLPHFISGIAGGAARRSYRTTTRCGARVRCGGVGSGRFSFVQRRLGDGSRWLLGWCAASAGLVKRVALVAAEWLARAVLRVLVEVLGGNLLAF